MSHNLIPRMFAWLIPGLVLSLVPAAGMAGDERPNVLFLAIDDLRCFQDCEVLPDLRLPTLESLAAAGRPFTRHYVHVPTCGASRCALLRGRRPTTAAHLSNNAIRTTHADWADNSLPGTFRRHGYRTLALGKITHYPGGRTGTNWDSGPEELPGVWDRCWIPESPWGPAQHMMHGYANGKPRNRGVSPPIQFPDTPDSAFPDAWVADEAVRQLEQLRDESQPWFFAVGFFKPHLPFAAPKSWFDACEDQSFPAPRASAKPDGVSSWHRSGEFRGNYGHSGRDPENDADYARLMRHAYAAAATYMDAQLERVVAALQSTGQADDTIIFVWSDHGFLLGEHAIWGKHCLYEEALRSPLIVIAPAVTQPGVPADAIVETVDVFPTIAELCDVEMPADADGSSLLPLLRDPHATGQGSAVSFKSPQQRTIRTDRWRLILHTDRSGNRTGAELFDFASDPFETTNVADQHAAIVEELAAGLPKL